MAAFWAPAVGGCIGGNAGPIARLCGRGRRVAERPDRGAPSCNRSAPDRRSDGVRRVRLASGGARESITVMPVEELDLLDGKNADGSPCNRRRHFAIAPARYSFFQLRRCSGRSRPTRSATRCGKAVWSGCGQRGLLGRSARRRRPQIFAGSTTHSPPRSQRHRAVARRQARDASQGWPGHWFLLPADEEADEDPLTALETAKDRVRILLDRYGIVVPRDCQSRRRRFPLGRAVPRAAGDGVVRRNRRRPVFSRTVRTAVRRACGDPSAAALACRRIVLGQCGGSRRADGTGHRMACPTAASDAQAITWHSIAAASCWQPKTMAAD